MIKNVSNFRGTCVMASSCILTGENISLTPKKNLIFFKMQFDELMFPISYVEKSVFKFFLIFDALNNGKVLGFFILIKHAHSII